MNELILPHYEDACRRFEKDNIVFLGVCGSQNYGLANANSDVDTRLLTTPTLGQIAFAKEPESFTLIRENLEHIDVTDFRRYIALLLKGNPNFLETLFTNFNYINPLYEKEFNKLLKIREEIVTDNKLALLEAIKGTIISRYKNLYNSNSEQQDKAIKKYGYNPKSLYQMKRMIDLFEDYYLRDCSFQSALHPNTAKRELLLEFKEGFYSLNTITPFADVIYNDAIKKIDEYLNKPKVIHNEEILNILYRVRYNIIKISIEKELNAK